jgi:MFS family permease
MSESATQVKYFTPKSIVTLIFGCLIPLCLSGTGMTAVMSNLPNIKEAMGLTTVGTAPAMMLVTATAWASGLVATKLIDLISPKWCLCIGSVATGIYVFLEATTTSYAVFVGAGLLNGIGMGMGTIAAAVGFANQYFGEKSGRVAALSLATMSLGGAALTAMLGAALTAIHWQTVLIGYALLCAVLGAILEIIFIHKPSLEVQERVAELREQKLIKKSEEAAVKADATKGYTLSEGLKTPAFWLMVIGMMTGAMALAAMGTYGTVFMVGLGMTMPVATLFMSLRLGFGGINVIWTGFLQAKIGTKRYLLIVYPAVILGLILLYVWTMSPAVIPLALIAFYFCSFYNCTTSVPALSIPDAFGYRDFNGFQAALTGFYFLGVFTSQLTSAIVLDALGPQSMIIYLMGTIVVALVSFSLALKFAPKKKLAVSE